MLEVVCPCQGERDLSVVKGHEETLRHNAILLGRRKLLIIFFCRFSSLFKYPVAWEFLPVGWELVEPSTLNREISLIPGVAHADSPPIIARIRSVTCFSSALITSKGRGGVNT